MKVELDEQILNEARQRRGNTDAQAWDNGDWIAGVVAECARQPGDNTMVVVVDGQRQTVKKPTRSDILRELAKHMGVSRATTSDLCQLAETYEPGIREEFGATLTIGHFREAMRCQTVPAVKLLERAVKSEPEWGGLPIPVDALRQMVRKYNAEVEPAKSKRELAQMYLDRAHKALDEATQYLSVEAKAEVSKLMLWLTSVKA